MQERIPRSYDVVIVGAGPVGLFLACELGLAGVSVLVLEQAADPHSPLKQMPFGVRGLSAPTIDAFYRRGMLAELLSRQMVRPGMSGVHWMRQARRAAGHFGGIQFYQDRIDAAAWPYRVVGPAVSSLPSTVADVETVMAIRVADLGVEIRRGTGVSDFNQTAEGVIVQQADGDQVSCLWLVGCDGGRSAVRKTGGFAFLGTEPEFTGYSVEVELTDPAVLAVGRHYTATGTYTFATPGTIAMVEFDAGVNHRAGPVTREHVQAVLRRISGAAATVADLKLATTWTDRAYQVSAYRRGRVLLAGDAAHIHSPLGGQGLNLGIGDAVNLGWKLAAVIRGDAPEGLLDTYSVERHPIGARVLDWSRAQVALMRPGSGPRALAGVIRDVIDTQDGATYFAERIWGVSLRYDLDDSHPLVGCSAPDFAFDDGSRLGGLLGTGNGLLLDFDNDKSLQMLAARYGERIAYKNRHPVDALGLRALLVRPDGIVAWVAEITPDLDGAARAAVRWFGSTGDGCLKS